MAQKPPLDEIGTSGGLNVLKPFRAAQQRSGTTGENTLHLLGITAKGGRTFRGIQHPQSSGGASTQVEEPASGTEALSNGIDRLCQGRGDCGDGFLGTTILVGKQLHQRQGVELIQA